MKRKHSSFVATVLSFTQRHISVVFVCLLIVLAIPPRIWNLSTTPPPINDEAANVRDITHILTTHTANPLFMQWDGSQAYLSYYPTLTLIEVFQIRDFYVALRMTSVLLSIAALIPLFFLAKRYMHSFIAFSTVLLFSYSYYYLEFSRVGWSAIYALTVGLYAAWFALRAQEMQSFRSAVVTTTLVGIGFYSYQGGFPLLIAALVILCTPNKTTIKMRKPIIVSLCIGAGIAVPWLIQILFHWKTYTLRAHTVSLFSQSLPYHGAPSWIAAVAQQIVTVVGSWIFLFPISGGGIENPRYLPQGYTPISPLLIPLFYIGIVYVIRKWKSEYYLLIIYGIVLIAQICTVNPPNGARALAVLPVLYLCIGQGANVIYRFFHRSPTALKAMVFSSFFIAYVDFLYYTYWMSWIQIINK